MGAVARVILLFLCFLAAAIAPVKASRNYASIHRDSLDEPPTDPPALTFSNATSAVQLGRLDAAVTCYDKCYAINRNVAVDATNWFCNTFFGTPTALMDFGDFKFGDYFYAPQQKSQLMKYYEEGHIYMRVSMDQASTCGEPTPPLDFQGCYHEIMGCVDNCNTSGENNKQGGFSVDGCLRFEFQPNPGCEPNCLISPQEKLPWTCGPPVDGTFGGQ